MSSSRRPFGPEGPECEWKVRPPEPGKLARTLAAFHNGAGGSLWVGVEDDGGLVGVEDLAAARGQVERAAQLCQPQPRLHFERRNVDGFVLLEVRVEPGDGACGLQARDGTRRLYVRDGDSSRPATEAQTRLLNRGRAAAGSLDALARRLLTLLGRKGPMARGDLARGLRTGERTCRRTLVPLIDSGLVQERPDGRLSLTPRGHRRA